MMTVTSYNLINTIESQFKLNLAEYFFNIFSAIGLQTIIFPFQLSVQVYRELASSLLM